MSDVSKSRWRSLPALLVYIAGLIGAISYLIHKSEDFCKEVNLCNAVIYALATSTEAEIYVWQEIARTQYDKENYEVAKELLDIAIVKAGKADWTLYRDRAKTSKRLNQYEDSIRDYKVVIELNPRRERAHLSPLESYLCLRDYTAGRKWISSHIENLNEADIKTFFRFFDLIFEMLLLKNYTTSYENYKGYITRNPISYFYRERFWSFDRTRACVQQASVSGKIKNAVMEIIKLTEQTTK